MYIPFENLADHSRIWIYQADRLLSADEIDDIQKSGRQFVTEWTAHQNTLHASFTVLHSLFLVLAVDESVNDASGCSIDKSVHFVQGMEKKWGVGFFNRLNVAYRCNEISDIKPLKEFISQYKELSSTTSLKVFNNLLTYKEELHTKWLCDVGDSWIAGRLKSAMNKHA